MAHIIQPAKLHTHVLNLCCIPSAVLVSGNIEIFDREDEINYMFTDPLKLSGHWAECIYLDFFQLTLT